MSEKQERALEIKCEKIEQEIKCIKDSLGVLKETLVPVTSTEEAPGVSLSSAQHFGTSPLAKQLTEISISLMCVNHLIYTINENIEL